MKTTRLRTSLRKAACVLPLLLGSLLFTSPARAQLATVDFAAIATAAEEYAEQAKRWSDTVKQYEAQVAHYQQMIARAANLNFSVEPTSTLDRITDISGMVAQACPGSDNIVDTALSITGLSSLNLGGNLAKNQQQICQQITLLQIDKYNKTADMLGRMHQYSDLFQQIDQLRNLVDGSSSVGDLQANTNEAARNANKLAKEISDWQGQIAANDAAIHALNEQQSLLANIALKGKSSPLGQIVQAGAFGTAFSD